jgi:AcrR family transcriptional regulator
VIGALRHVVSRHLRTHSEDQLPRRLEDGLAWLSSYAAPAGSVLWSTSPAAVLRGAVEHSPPAVWAAEILPAGTHGLPAGVIARSQRRRLIFATAEVMMAKGYQHAKITDIVARARVRRDVFYRRFAGKEEAFLEAQRHPTQYMLDSCTRAYFSVDEWPQRLWRALEMLLRLIAENPAISHLGLIESYAAGPAAIRRAEENTSSFTFFLEEGYRYREEAGTLPHLFSQAIAGAIFEIIRRHVGDGRFARLAARLPQLAYIAIAPFAGAEKAIGLVEAFKAELAGGVASADHPLAKGGCARAAELPGGWPVQQMSPRAAGRA